MRTRLVLVTTAALACQLAAPAALAGDPCPIDHAFHDVGPPEWLDREALLGALASKDSWVGLSFRTAKQAGGVQITRLSDDGPAAKAGVKKGDVVTAVDGQAMTTHEALSAAFRARAPGAKVTLTLTRDGASRDVSLVLGAQDPLIGAMIDVASTRECTDVRRVNLTPERAAEIRGAVFSKMRRFRCDDAHKALKKVGLYGGDLVIVRGSKRILVANAGWATTCVSASAYDGAKLTPKAVGKLLDKVAKRYVKDRHDNP